MHKNSDLRTRNAPSLKITLTSGAFLRVHKCKNKTIQNSQPSFRTPISTVPQLNIRTSCTEPTEEHRQKQIEIQGIYFLNTRSRYLGGFQRTASCPTLTHVLGDSLVKAERRIQHQQRFDISPLFFFSNESFS